MLFSSNRKTAIKKLKNLVLNAKTEIPAFREKIESVFSTPILPNRVSCSCHTYGSIDCDLLLPEIYSTKRLIIYIHGGCFVAGSKASWRGFCASLANITSSRVLVPEFRLSPANAFPAALEDIQACFRTVYIEEEISASLENSSDNQEKLPEIILAADGSGAVLTLAFLANLKSKYKKSIRQVILFSPWLNLSPSALIFKQKKKCDEVFSAECLKKSGELYTYSSNLENPFVSPFFANEESLENFPPVYIQMGEKEILLPDAQAYQAKLKNLGIECTIDIWKDMMFMFQMADEELPEAHLAIEKIGKLITARKTTAEDFFADYSTPVRSSIYTES